MSSSDPTPAHATNAATEGRAETDGAVEHLDVLIVGAGLSGIAAGHHLETTSPWADYAVFEARQAIGGTWDLFRYPGIRSDSDMFTFGYSLRPWDGDQTIGEGADIRDYIVETARVSGVDRKIRFGHRILSADYVTAEAHWKVTAQRVAPDGTEGEAFELTCGFLFSCTGYYRYDKGHTPDFPGMDTFDGQIIHPQQWPEDLDYAGKKVVVIGSGATAITLIPNLAEDADGVTMLQRSPSYVAAAPSTSYVSRLFKKLLPESRSGSATRWFHAVSSQAFFAWCQKRPEAARRLLMAGMRKELPDGYDVERHFTPKYGPWDQRLCLAPDGDFFAAIRKGTADVVTDKIKTFTPNGIQLASGDHLDADIVVTATGLELLFLGGMDLTIDGADIDLPSRLTYRGMMLDGVPNLAMAIGYTNASWTLKADLTCAYVPQLLNEMRRRGMRQAMPRNDDPSISSEPMLSLTSGYVQRSSHLFPQQGTASPWRNHQRYLTDYNDMKKSPIIGEGMELSNPSPVRTEPAEVSATGF